MSDTRAVEVTVVFTDLVDDGVAGLGNLEHYVWWVRSRLEGMRDIVVEDVHLREVPL